MFGNRAPDEIPSCGRKDQRGIRDAERALQEGALDLAREMKRPGTDLDKEVAGDCKRGSHGSLLDNEEPAGGGKIKVAGTQIAEREIAPEVHDPLPPRAHVLGHVPDRAVHDRNPFPRGPE